MINAVESRTGQRGGNGSTSPNRSTVADKRAVLASRLRQAAGQLKGFPLSFAQQRLWFLDQLEPNSPLYNMPVLLRMAGNLNSAALEQALNEIVRRHDALRTRFVCSEESPIQIIEPEMPLKLRQVDLSSEREAEREEEARRVVHEEIHRPFNLSNEPLLRAMRVRLGPEEHWLLLTMHHIVSDGWSLVIFFRELGAFYDGFVRGRPVTLAELPIQYKDFALWQRQQRDLFEEQLKFWKDQLGGNPPMLELPADRPRRPSPTFRGRCQSLPLGAELSARVKELARRENVTLFMLLLAAFKTLLYRYTQQEDIIVGSPTSGRDRLETEALIGFFVNTLALRTRLDGNLTFKEILARVRQVTLESYAHQDLPFERMVEELHPERSLSHLPFTRVMFVHQNETVHPLNWPGLSLEFLEAETDTAKFDMTFTIRETTGNETRPLPGDGAATAAPLVARVEYNTDLFDGSTISRLLKHFETLLEGIIANPTQRIADLPLLTQPEREQLLVTLNTTTTSYARSRCIHEIFEAQVERTPAATAVSFGNQSISYRELNERANQLARYLKQFNIGPGVPVAICVERSLDMVVGFLGVLKAGGAYVPLDAAYPKERLAFMLTDVQTPVLLTQQRLLAHIPGGLVKVICLDADWELIAREERLNPASGASPEDLAYIMYTSGSTGQPKGVAVPHRAVNRLVLNTNYVEFGPSERIAQVSNISFDAATFEIWGALLNGGQLVGITRDVALSSADFARELREKKISAMFLTAALFNQLASDAPGAFETVRTVIAGGEALDPKWIRTVLQNRPPQRLLNGYGPTENTTFSCCHLIERVASDATSIPIGRPIANTQVYILDPKRKLLPIGVPGELYVGGDGLARGYWNRPELTAEKFVPNPFDSDGSAPNLYRTGDLCRYLADGTIEFLGRLDDQVKIRGFRIELGEIETFLGQHPNVRECVLTVYSNGTGLKRLVAYFVPNSTPAPNASELRAFLQEKLPDYMVPAIFVQLGALPLSPNGKVDRKALPKPDKSRPELEKQYASPRDAVEAELTQIWENILGVHPIGIEDKFFDLGGHSLLAVRVIAQIEKHFHKKLRLATIFQAPTIEQLAAIIREEIKETSATAGTSIVEIQSKGTKPPLFFVHGAGGGMFWGYVNLSRHLGNDQPVYAFKSCGLDGGQEFETIEEMARYYVADLRKVQPQGPYYLGGYCFGGNVAFEIARQLKAQGEEIALLALMNCAPPNSRYTTVRPTPGWCLRFLRNLFYAGKFSAQWTPVQRQEFFRWKWNLVKRRLLGVGKVIPWPGSQGSSLPSGQLAQVDPGDLVDLSSFSPEQRKLWETHIQALLNYHAQPFDGRVHLFRSPVHQFLCSFDADYGWGDYARNGVSITVVPNAHEKILEEPSVKVLADALSKLLGREEPRGEAPRSWHLPGDSNTRGDQLEKHLIFWKDHLKGTPALLEMPTDHSRPAIQSCRTATQTTTISAKGMRGLQSLGKVDMVFLAALTVLLRRYSRQDDIVVGADRESRNQSANGALDQPLILRTDLSDDPPADQLLERIRSATALACEHGDVSFAKLVEELQLGADQSYHPIFQVLFTRERAESGNLLGAPTENGAPTSKLDLKFRIAENAQGALLAIEYATDLFEADTVRRMLGHWETLARNMAANPKQPVSQLRMLTDAEERTLLVDWVATQTEYPQQSTLTDLFEEQVRRTPDAQALVSGTTRLTYRQLQQRATTVAERLKVMGVGNEMLVGICLERSWEMVAGILGTLQVGAAYVPMDPAYPRERLAFMLEDSKAKVLLTQTKLVPSLQSGEAELLCVEDVFTLDSKGQNLNSTFARPKATDLAYVIYTSGSTGKPKGVAIEHRSAVAFVHWARDVFTEEELSGVLAATSICFDLSIFEMFVPLSWGGKVILADNALALPRIPASQEVILINTVPSAIRELLRMRGVPASVKVVNLAGEPLATPLVNQIYAETNVETVYDLYGPTETTTYSTFTLRKPDVPATIGRPLANEQVFLLDPHRQLVPVGVPGELHIGGDGLARCYLNRPELTAERFIPHPFKAAARLYRTGDLARWRPDGNLEYLGRIDHQVKIRGFRIELGEVESVLKKHPDVREVVAMAREDRPGDKRLIAYVVAERSLTADQLKSAGQQKLPDYMVPSAFVFLEALPLTPNGKVDRKALPAPDFTVQDDSEFLAPTNSVEEQLASIWRDVLGFNQVSVSANFFDLGGHSLLAIQVLSRIREVFDLELPLSTLFDAPTIRALAEVLASAEPIKAASGCRLEPIPRNANLPLSFVQERLWFLDQLEPGSHAYNVPAALRLSGKLDRESLQNALNVLIRRHEPLRTTFQNESGNLKQVITPTPSVEIALINLENTPVAERQTRAQQLVNAEAQRPFDLERGPLIRAKLIRLSDTDHAFVVVMHHAISDGWSLSIFFEELQTLYRAFASRQAQPELPPLPIQYADYACWQRNWMAGPRLEKELSYWKEKLAGAPSAIEFPASGDQASRLPQSAGATPAPLSAGRWTIHLPEPIADQIVHLNRQGYTPFVVLMSALAATLQKWTGQEDLVLGTVVAGRNRRELEKLIGCFMNFLPIRLSLSANKAGGEILAAVKATILEAQAHQDCPFEKIVEALNPDRLLNRNPLYNVALLFQNFPAAPFAGEGLESATMPAEMDAALLDLRFEAEQTANSFALSCEYRRDLFDDATIEALLKGFIETLNLLTTRPQARLAEFQIGVPFEKAAIELPASQQPTSGDAAPVTGSAGLVPSDQQTIAITATFTAEPIQEALSFWMDRLSIPARVEFAPFNQVFQQLLDPSSLVGSNQRGINVILIRLEDWQRASESQVPGSDSGADKNVERSIADFIATLKSAASRSAVPFLVCLCPPSTEVTGNPDRQKLFAGLEQNLLNQLQSASGIYFVTSEEVQRLYPVHDYYDANGQELGHVPYTPPFFTALATVVARKFLVLNRPAYKVLALDCDQTLWSGVCGEDGPKGITFDPPRKALHQFVRAQQEAGMLLCLCSKNNEEDVREVFAQRDDLALRWEHFAGAKLNWQPKSENLKALARELNLGLDSFILLDDNPVECAEVAANAPEVLALQLPQDPEQIPQFLQHCWVFDRLKVTEEDRKRALLYQQNQQREQLKEQSPNLADFIAGLELKIEIQAMAPEQLTRVAQLTQRTNQFNCTTLRRTETEIQKLKEPLEVLTVSVSDRFGDYGLVGVVIHTVNGDALEVDTFLLSCRVLGRGVEHRVLAHLGAKAQQRGLGWIDVQFHPSQKNKPALDFLQGIGARYCQPQNGGSLFRFPASFAAAIQFAPAQVSPASAPGLTSPDSIALNPSGLGNRLTLYRQLPLEYNDVAAIHRAVEAQAAPTPASDQSAYVAPRNDLERQVCEVWERLLRRKPIGIHENFFDLGGHSLLAVRLFAELQTITGRKLPLVTLFQAPTIEQLTAVIAQRASDSRSPLVPIQPQGSKPPLFLVHGAGGDVLWGYANLAKHLSNDQPIYGLKSRGQLGLEEFSRLEDMAGFYLEAVRKFQPHGPYYLGGYCFGGNVAYEMARKLRAQGEQVALVALLDTAPSNAGYERMRWWHPAFPYRFIRNLYHWTSDFDRLSADQRRKFVARKLRFLCRKLMRRLRRQHGTTAVDLEEVIEPSQFPQNELKLWEIHLRALIEHVERPYDGKVTLLRTKGQPLFCSLEQDFCWRRLVRGGVIVKLVPGSHENIFMEPNVQFLARELERCLAVAE